MRRAYYTLIGQPEKGSPFEILFGDYDPECVYDERETYRDEYKQLLILTTTDAQSDIDAALARVNK